MPMYAIIFPLSIFSLTFPDRTNNFTLLVKRMNQTIPLDLKALEPTYYSNVNIEVKRKALKSVRISNLKRSFLIIVNHYNQFFPFDISRSNNLLELFEENKKLEYRMCSNLENAAHPNVKRKIYKKSKDVRENLMSLIVEMTSQIFDKLSKSAYDPFYIFALAEIKNFIKEMSSISIDKKQTHIILCFKIECSSLYARTSYYLSTLQEGDYFYEDFVIYKYILYSISINIYFHAIKKFKEVEQSTIYTLEETFDIIKYKIIAKFQHKSKYMHENIRIYLLFQSDFTIIYAELLDFVDFVSKIRQKTNLIEILEIRNYIVQNFQLFKKRSLHIN